MPLLFIEKKKKKERKGFTKELWGSGVSKLKKN